MYKMSCIVCLYPVEKKYHCSDNKCHGIYCDECITLLINYSKDENILPVCPATNCNQILLLSNLPKNIIPIYQQLCFDFFIKEQGDTINKQIVQKDILEKIKKERRLFINDHYPAAIALIADITFKSKMTKIENIKKKLIKEEDLKRKCLNNTCNGFLNDLTCIVCQSVFCKMCEKKLNKNHFCNQEDIDSVNFVNNLIRCPKCNVPVFKNVGCDAITCSVCSTNFNYKTGDKADHGSLNVKIAVNINQRQKLSITHAKIPSELLTLLITVESKEPPIISKDILLQPIKEYYQNKNNTSMKLIQRLEKYQLNKLANRDYQSLMVELETLLIHQEYDKAKETINAWLKKMIIIK